MYCSYYTGTRTVQLFKFQMTVLLLKPPRGGLKTAVT
jgi:hypothetical protein